MSAEESQDPSIAVDPNTNDSDSAISVSVTNSLDSLRSSLYKHQEENGRTYHAYNAGKYHYPNDSRENERLVEGANRVLDLGAGTGCWAIDYADLHPKAEVIGVDLSPIQPTSTPPNCSFEIDDLEKQWTWSKPFDFIITRAFTGSMADYQDFVNKAYEALEPGGWFEWQDLHMDYGCDDNTLDPESELGRLGHLFNQGSEVLGRPTGLTYQFRDYVEKAGFEKVTERNFKWPLNTWPQDKHYKDIGAAMTENLDFGVEGLTMAICTRGLKWTVEETHVFCANFRRQLKDRNIHAYMKTFVVYGQKPMTPTS